MPDQSPAPRRPRIRRRAPVAVLAGRSHRLPPRIDSRLAAEQVSGLHGANGGATFSLYFGNLSGRQLYAVSLYPERSVVIAGFSLDSDALQRFIEANLDLLHDPRNSIGTWFDVANRLTYLDVSAIVADEEGAIALAERYNQIAIFDLQRLAEVTIGGAGDEIPGLPPVTERLPPRTRRRRKERKGSNAGE